ncbi:MAG: trimethylamine methyltransferase family protein [Spirochaetota bacterium]
MKGLIRMVTEGFPCTILSGPLAGTTSSYTIASNVIQWNAEALSGLVISQLVNKRAPLLVYIGGGQFDMRSLTALLGTPEVALMIIAGAQLARFYGIPSHACIPCSDSHCLDQQLGIENMMLILVGLLCRTDLMVNAGMFATGETAAFEQLVIDNDHSSRVPAFSIRTREALSQYINVYSIPSTC